MRHFRAPRVIADAEHPDASGKACAQPPESGSCSWSIRISGESCLTTHIPSAYSPKPSRRRGLAELFGFSFASASSICLALDRVATFRGIFAVSQDLSAMASQARGNTNGNSRRKTPSRTRNPRLVWQWQLPSKARDKIEAPPIGIVQANENFAEEETNRCLNIGTNGTIHFDSIPDADAITFRPRS